ncbi:P-loop NTPase family protein [Streptantibioticus cattleyicolor]|uniref:Uncharacterized protein n=1 Tax=Streptantibioticus cattleyicolor (strain ATCC 35852 / DSM 46488 / JCM 4925 / NBRC 14057 / NRRL 8057) TaxID=1003195 RepID=F8JMS6_STREN|nr:ATP-binding protein [Streptantibioticus cattleyicolor]AEW99288.1 hypothetical protein SCATT_p10950 [Streptantibioticus cattleyicolor NRRL 8057 = DSM 46488]CCB71672.1 conserved protein of unknown function [Streptantibioticus cattleyicolor NRRL 8057 = DSM 46488]
MSGARLYGRRRIVDFVDHALRRDGGPRRPLPILLLTGPRGSGGSALLAELWEEFSLRALGARLDLSAAQGVEDIVLATMQGLGRRVPGIRPIDFPRLRMAFKALSFVDDGGGRVAFEAYLRAGRRDAAVMSALYDWADRAAPLLNSPGRQLLMTAAVRALGGLLSGIRGRRDARILRWYAGNGISSGGTEYDPLWELYGWHHQQLPAAARKVGKTLCAAFLADLRSDFHDVTVVHGRRPANCLLLLDNTGGRAGELFLELLAECRRDDHRARALPDPAVIVAVQRGRVRRRTGEPVAATDERLVLPARDPAGPDDDHPTWWYPVRLTDLGERDVAEVCRSSVLGSGSRDADFLHALTGGHPAATDRLATLLAIFGRQPFDPRRLLDTPLPPAHQLPDHWAADDPGDDGDGDDEPTVEDHLLARTLGADFATAPEATADGEDDPLLDTMAVLAATPGLRPAACTATLAYLGWDAADATEARQRLAAALWLEEDPGGAASRVHPLAALLLRRRLARRPRLWRDVHEGYAVHYSRHGDTVLHQHHTLARAEPSDPTALAQVVGHLAKRFDDEDTGREEWLAVLDRITAAPTRLRTTRDPRGFVTTLAGAADPGDRERILTRLTVARWLHHDRCFDPFHRLAQLIANEYDYLAALSADDSDVLFRRSAQHRALQSLWEG